MAEYITKEQAYNSVDERIDELRADKEFNIVKEICISGVKKHIETVPTADVVERDKVKQARRELDKLPIYGAKFTDDFRIHLDRDEVFAIIDKLIAESEE